VGRSYPTRNDAIRAATDLAQRAYEDGVECGARADCSALNFVISCADVNWGRSRADFSLARVGEQASQYDPRLLEPIWAHQPRRRT
jgi:hypothetical protein